MDLADETIEERVPVWQALSELFLDTELDENNLQRIATILQKSPYSMNELEAILYDEVSPVCMHNLLSVAGEWASFDSAWLKERIVEQKRNKLFKKFTTRFNRWMIKEDWEKIKLLLEPKR